ncbi:MAG: PH domain-containing protein [Krumholzibacteria bacterium]|nr:PH domain-containing protein [Candidatus Krumholzibacteria bacterium]
MNDMDVSWYRSKVDWWLGVILAAAPLVTFGALGASLVAGDSAGTTAAVVTCVVTVALYGLLVVPVRYGIARSELIVRFGVVRQRIPLASIVEVKPTRNPLSSPALSLDRLAVRTGPGFSAGTMISPADREAFLAMLATRAGLKRDGDRLVRA